MSSPGGFVAAAIEPTREQAEIQVSDKRSIVVQANAGAAKTTTLALRIGEALAGGIAPERLLALTFTPPACRALAEALKKVGVPYAAWRRVPILTFDDFAAGVLLSVERGRVLFKSTPEALAPCVWQAVRALDMSADDGIVERFLRAAQRIKGTLGRDLLSWEGVRLTEETAEDLGVEFSLLRLFDAYEHIRYPRTDGCDRPRFRGEFDATYDLARILADPESATPLHEIGGWPRQLEHLLVDEMHDLNLAMFTVLVALLRNGGTRFCGVGDFDQVVHATAGAERRFMDRDVELGGNRRVVLFPLTATRRFDARLARAAGRFAGKPYASESAHATVIACRQYAEEGAGACELQVLEVAKAWRVQTAGRMSALAILLRHPYQSVLIENELIREELPYVALGFESYLMQPEVLLVRALLAVATRDFESLASEATRRRLVRAVIFFCGTELTHDLSEEETQEERIEDAVSHIAQDAASLAPFFDFQVLERGEPAMVRRLRAAIEVAQTERGPEMFPRFLEALQMRALVRTVFVEKERRADAMAYMAGLARAALAYPSAADFFMSLNRAETRLVATHSPLKNEKRAAALKKGSLVLATVAAVKGLEYEHVVLPYLAQGEFPADGAAPVEERNLFYVGITRARSVLTLLASERRPSEFVAALGL